MRKRTPRTSDAGGLGSFGAAGTPPDRLRTTVQAIRQRTGRAFNINPFSAHTEDFDRDARAGPRLAERLEIYHSELGLDPVPDPARYSVSRDLRKAAAERGDPDFIAMWAGQGVGLMRRRAAADLVNDLVVESQQLLARLVQD